MDIDPVEVRYGPGGSTRGWMVALWVCHDIRLKAYGDARIWARAYNQMPDLGRIRCLAKSAKLHYRVSPHRPRSRPDNYNEVLQDDERLDVMCSRSAFEDCCVIESDSRGDALSLLRQLVLKSPLNRLEFLSVLSEKSDPEEQRCVSGVRCRPRGSFPFSWFSAQGLAPSRVVVANGLREVSFGNCWVVVESCHLRVARFTYSLPLQRPPLPILITFFALNQNTLCKVVYHDHVSDGTHESADAPVLLPALRYLEVMDATPNVILFLAAIERPFPTVTLLVRVSSRQERAISELANLGSTIGGSVQYRLLRMLI